jgi:hypothetical protein
MRVLIDGGHRVYRAPLAVLFFIYFPRGNDGEQLLYIRSSCSSSIGLPPLVFVGVRVVADATNDKTRELIRCQGFDVSIKIW